MNAAEVRQTVIAMLSAETGCEPDHLTDGGIHVVARIPERTSWQEHHGFKPHPGRIAAVTLGDGAVISVDAEHLDWARQTFTAGSRDELFRDQMLMEFVRYGAQKGLTVYGPYPRFTSPLADLTEPSCSPEYSVRVADLEAEMAANPAMIDRTQYPNTIFPGPGLSGRPMVLAAVAEFRGEIIGIAGVSKDSKFMYQIGIDVVPRHRGKRLAPALTYAAARAAFNAGALPYYCTSSANIASMRTAIKVGLRPTWVEVLTRPA